MANQGSSEPITEAANTSGEANLSSKEGAASTEAAAEPRTEEPDRAGQVANLEKEKADLYDRLLRKQAELENYRKRVEREKGEWYHQGVVDLVKEFLPVMDACERALASFKAIPDNTPAVETLRSGVELIYKQFQGVMKKFGVTAIEALGEPFNPHLHEAIARVETEEHEENRVVEELQRGYLHREKLLRPSVVKVSATPSASSTKEGA